MNICICGGGSLGHVIAGKIASYGEHVSILTRRPEQWRKSLIIDDCKGESISGKIQNISDNPSDIIPSADIVLLCLPGFAMESELQLIQPYLKSDCYVGSVVCCTGFFFIAYKILRKGTPLFGFQRAPYIARVKEYGKSAHLLGYKKELQIATVHISAPASLQTYLQKVLDTPVRLLNHFLEASLTNSNPLLHPARLYGLFHLWKEGVSFSVPPTFYKTWDNKSSQLLIDCDKEFHDILSALPVKIAQIPTILDYYDSYDAESLTQKIRSIEAFKGILAPMQKIDSGYIPDFSSRYFQEDIPFGLLIIKSIAEILKVNTPYIDKVLNWAQSMIGKHYLIDGHLSGSDLIGTGHVSAELFFQLIKDN